MKHRLHTLCVLAVLAAATEVRAAKPQTTKQRTRTHNLVVAHKTGELYSVLIGDESLVEINNVKRLLDSGVSVNAVLTNVEKDRPITEAAGWGNAKTSTSGRYGLPRPAQRELDGQMISYLVQIGEQPNEPAIINS